MSMQSSSFEWLEILKTIVAVSILFVWVVRYNNIVQEFNAYQIPSWVRDLVGIFKISFAIMLMSGNIKTVQFGAIGIAILMSAAFFTHLRTKNTFFKMIPSISLLSLCSLIIFLSTAQN